jgi:hypothetical protein
VNTAPAQGALPLGLCGLLVAAAACTLFPRWPEPVLQPARWLMCLPLRAWPARYVEAAAPDAAPARSAFVAAALARLAHDAATPGIDGAEPVICRVLERRVPGAARLPSLLVLDRPWSEVAECNGLVTRAGSLVGFLGEASDAADASAHGHAVVRCVHAVLPGIAPVRVVARSMIDAHSLRFVLEPGSRIDPWPLRVGLLEDPYRAARSGSAGVPVHTAGGVARGVTIPAGLALGTLRVWGYAEQGAATLPVGFFVEPAFDAHAIATVVLWRPRADGAHTAATTDTTTPATTLDALAANLHPVRSAVFPSRQRLYLVTGSRSVPIGAAVVDREGQLVGTVDASGPGDAVASTFAVPGRQWSLLLVPDDNKQAPIECSARVIGSAGDEVELRLVQAVEPCAGEVLTGGHGLHCPPGLWVGRIASFAADGTSLRVSVAPVDARAVGVYVLPQEQP